MDASDQVYFVLKVAINIAPIAIYFLVLGLVNSQAHPQLVNARSDFVTLTLVFVPALVWPVPLLVTGNYLWLLYVGLVLGLGVFLYLLPAPMSGWVVYNISEPRCRRALEQAVGRLGWGFHWQDRSLIIPQANLRIDLSSFPLLRNVSLYFRPIDGALRPERIEALRESLSARLTGFALLPSTTGACLLIVGVGLLIVPLWMVSRHMNEIVELVQKLLFA